MTDAFDADVLIYAATPGNTLGERVVALLAAHEDDEGPPAVGSLLLLPELLSKPVRERDTDQQEALAALLVRLDLHQLEEEIAELSVELSARYRLRTADAVHLATAVHAGADRFITNNRRDFPQTIDEIAVTYPEDLPDPA